MRGTPVGCPGGGVRGDGGACWGGGSGLGGGGGGGEAGDEGGGGGGLPRGREGFSRSSFSTVT